jgi:hypothetical protein
MNVKYNKAQESRIFNKMADSPGLLSRRVASLNRWHDSTSLPLSDQRCQQ